VENDLQYRGSHGSSPPCTPLGEYTATHRNTLQHTETHCDTPKHMKTHRNTLLYACVGFMWLPRAHNHKSPMQTWWVLVLNQGGGLQNELKMNYNSKYFSDRESERARKRQIETEFHLIMCHCLLRVPSLSLALSLSPYKDRFIRNHSFSFTSEIANHDYS